MKIKITHENESLIMIIIQGKLDLEHIKTFEDETASCLSINNGTILLNLSDLSFIDSSGVGAVIKFTNRSKISNNKVIFFNLSKAIADIFQRSYLDRFFNIKSLSEIKNLFPALKV